MSASTFASHWSSVVNESRPSAAPGWAAPPPGPTKAQITWLSWLPFALSSRSRTDQARQFMWISTAAWLPRRSMIAVFASCFPSLTMPAV